MHLNTLYVDIKLCLVCLELVANINLNTLYVDIKLIKHGIKAMSFYHLNTLYVDIKHYPQTLDYWVLTEFKYIIC